MKRIGYFFDIISLKFSKKSILFLLWGMISLGLSACSSLRQQPVAYRKHKTYPISTLYRAPPKKHATARPYRIKGTWYFPMKHYNLDEVGIASHYGDRDKTHGRPTATGERFNMYGLTAAHKTAPLPSIAIVTNLENGRSLKIKLNDRGPFKKGRILDVSSRVASLLGFYKKGIARVRVRILPQESMILAQRRVIKKS